MISIADLPDDILIAIFFQCTAPTEDINFSSLDATSPLWTLARVSQSWRAITITTPLLWAKIRIPLFRYLQNSHRDHKPTPAKIVARTQHLLQLTQECKLDIVILVRRDRAFTIWNELVRSICASAPRWRRFTSDASHALYAALQGETFPCLEHLGIAVSEMYVRSSASDEAPQRIDCFKNAHALRSLSLNAIEDCTSVLELALPWHNLTAYSTNMGRMLNASLHLLSSVEELHVKLEEEMEEAEDDAFTATPDAVQVFPRLTTLDLDLSDGHTHGGALQPYVKTILRRLHAPSLTKLRLRICGFQFISKPLLLHCNLDNVLDLSIHDEAPCLSTDIPDFWRLMPNVEVLHLWVGRSEIYFNAVMGHLWAFPPVPVPLPRLKVLSFHASNMSFGLPSIIVKIALQRRRAVEKKLWMPLEEVRVQGKGSEFGRGVKAAAVESLKEEYERQRRSPSLHEDEGLAPLRIYGVQSDS